MGLKEYKAKRNFGRTAEPPGKRVPAHKELLFAVQKHDATRLHYDFRLEMEGVLKSWAVPKGFPWKKGERRLAVQVEDHPFDYKDFEGIIPAGNYGAGTVMLWDTGTYTVGGGDPLKALEQGKLHLFLKGKKLDHEWTLVRLRRTETGDKPQWLLIKSGADVKPLSAKQDDASAATGRSLKQIAADADHTWKGAPMAKMKLPKLPADTPRFLEPMKARITRSLPTGDEWLFEIKFDGIRALALKDGKNVELFSRAGNALTSKYPMISESVKGLPARKIVLDGEVAALDEQGRSSFQVLQAYHMSVQRPPLVYYVFDILHLEGKSLRELPCVERKKVLEALLKNAPENLRFSPALDGEARRVVDEMRARGLEGLIAKKRDGPYEIGRRGGSWLKFKWVAEQEFVIGGYTRPKGGRAWFGALLVGYYKDGKLLFAGKVGTGFDEPTLRALHEQFQKKIAKECPFANLPEKRMARGGGLTAGQMRLCTWVQPKLVAQVRFAEWTRDNHLRHPAFMGLREDKDPRAVVRE